MIWNKSMDKVFRVIGVDPGSQCFGLSVIDFDLETFKTSVVHSETFHATPMLDEASPIMNLGARGARHHYCRQFVTQRCRHFKPQLVCCESAFMRLKFVTAFQSLVEGIVNVRQAVADYDDTLELLLVDPPTAKKAVGAPGKGGDKLAILVALRKLQKEQTLIFDNVDLETLDEHARDSVAIGVWGMKKWLTHIAGII